MAKLRQRSGIGAAMALGLGLLALTPTGEARPASAAAATRIDDRAPRADASASIGAIPAGALAAYRHGATGRGVVVAVIDSGIAADDAAFAGRISRASADIAGSRGLGDDSGHGTAVAAVLLGARGGAGPQGIAFDATLLAVRADQPGSCAAPASAASGCRYSNSDIARGIDLAVAQGARVINLSLGSVAVGPVLRAAIVRATAAGAIIVVSAGNDGAADPHSLGQLANDVAVNGQVIVVGSVDADGAIARFSNRAGNSAAHYLAAPSVAVPLTDARGSVTLAGGTSFSAPLVAGAAALLAQAHPTLDGAQIVRLLHRSATDLGAPGVDPVYGWGQLNIARAFEVAPAPTLVARPSRVGRARF